MTDAQAQIRSKVRGVSHHQPQTAWCRTGTLLRPVREPRNRHDRNAIRLDVRGGILFKSWRPIGYIGTDLAGRFAPQLDRGLELRVAVLEVTGSRRSARGVNILIEFDEQRSRQIVEAIASERLAVERGKDERRLAAERARNAKRREAAERVAVRRRAHPSAIAQALAVARRAGARLRAGLRAAGQQQLGTRSDRQE